MDDCWNWCHSFRANEKEFSKYGGRLNGFQLWVNLPKNKRMMTPRYQEIPASKIPSASTKDSNITVKVIADESLGAKAEIDTITPILYLHFKLEPGSRMVQPVPKEYNVFAYLIKGKGVFVQTNNNKIIERGNLVIFDKDGKGVYIQSVKIQKFHLNYY